MPRIKPTRHYIKSKLPCTHAKLKYRIDQKHILCILIDELHYNEGAKMQAAVAKLTRTGVETEIYRNLRNSGEDWFERENHNPEYVFDENKNHDLKQVVMQTAQKLFPDWFASNSVKLILDLAKEDS
jgi:hypothetical protein